MKRRRFIQSILFLMLVLMAGLRCSGRHDNSDPSLTEFALRPFDKPSNIILISVDTLRGDYVNPQYMPRLMEFARENCVVFTNAHSHSTWTRPSHVTMLTGMLPSEHGVEYQDSVIPSETALVQERLKQVGYTTAAFVSGGHVDREWGFDRGFDRYFQQTDAADNKEREEHLSRNESMRLPVEKAKEFLEEVEMAEKPFFVFIHTNEVHDYWHFHDWEEGALEPPIYGTHTRKKFLEETSYEQKRQTYGKAVSEFDDRLAELMESALGSSLSDNLCVIITSDHGESLGEKHGTKTITGHGRAPFAEQIRIPLIIYGINEGVSDRLIGIDEITPLVLWMVGNDADALFPDKREILMSEHINQRRKSTDRAMAMVTPTEKYLLTNDGVLRLYRDPEDSVDLLHAREITAMTAEPSESLRGELKALGYLN